MAVRTRGIRVEGFRDLDAALGKLSKSVGRRVLKNALIKAGEPMRARAEELAPRESGELAESVIISGKVKNTVGNKEFAQALAAGLGQRAAVAAMRQARRNSTQGSFAEVELGPQKATNKADAVKRIVQEFGSFNQSGKPFMRPAFAEKGDQVVTDMRDILATEINRAIARQAKRQLKAKK